MQQEDDLRALEKIVQFARALGIVFLGLNSYWFCYDWFAHHALTTPVVDRIFRKNGFEGVEWRAWMVRPCSPEA